MKFTRIMIRIVILLLPGILLLFQGRCSWGDDENCNQAPYGCITSEPDNGLVILYLDLQKSLEPVKVEIYDGNVEDGDLLRSFIASKSEDTLWLNNGDISARAIYRTMVNGNAVTVSAIDGDRLKAHSERYCDGVVCYSEGSIELDLRLDETVIGRIP